MSSEWLALATQKDFSRGVDELSGRVRRQT